MNEDKFGPFFALKSESEFLIYPKRYEGLRDKIEKLVESMENGKNARLVYINNKRFKTENFVIMLKGGNYRFFMFDPVKEDTILFLSTVIHELKNPLSAIKALVQMANMELESKDVSKRIDTIKDYLTKSIKELDRMNSILSSIKELSRPKLPHSSEFDIVKIIEDIVSLWKPELNQKGIEIEFKSYIESGRIVGSKDSLYQIFSNLIKNSEHALKGRRDPKIEIFINKFQNKYIAKIRDNGCGMDERNLKRIKEAFVTTKSDGLGLGLFIVKKLMEEYGGKLDISSEVGKGTEVVLTFPL